MGHDKKSQLFTWISIICFLFLLITGPITDIKNLTSLLVQIFGLLLVLWALITKKISHKEYHKLPKGIFFIKIGPYEILRHPVYAGLLLYISSSLQYNFSVIRVLIFFLFIGAIIMKIIREESYTQQYLPEYKEYKQKTKALIPYLL